MFNRKDSHKFFDDAAQCAADITVQNKPSEGSIILAFPVLVGMLIESHAQENATKFRNALVMLAAHAAMAEQWTQPAPHNAEECPDCVAQAAEDRAKREALAEQEKRDAEDLTLRDFWWTIHGDGSAPFGAMIVTRQRSSYPHINLDKWKLVRARDYGHAVVKAADAAAAKQAPF